MKYSILEPYFDRLEQFRATLVSFAHFYGHRDDVEVIVIEDRKNKDDIAGLIADSRAGGLGEKVSFAIHHIKEVDLVPETGTDFWTACHLYNLAALKARGEYLVITNPECFHNADVLAGLDTEFSNNDDAYVVCSCQAVDALTFTDPGDFSSVQYEPIKVDTSMWLQHSRFHDRMLNYCTAMSARTYDLMNGFDLRFCAGFAFGDNDFRDRVILRGLEIAYRDDLLTLHQRHRPFKEYVPDQDYRPFHSRNKEIYMAIKEKRGHYTKIMSQRKISKTNAT